MARRRSPSFPALLSLLAASCGGQVVVDASSGAGGGTTTSSTTTDTSGTDCDALRSAFAAAIDAARACNPILAVVQCSGSQQIDDACGCSVILNENNVGPIEQAKTARDAFLAAGCELLDCDVCQESTNGYCQQDGSAQQIGHCQPAFAK